MNRRRLSRFVPVGLLVLVAGIFLQHFTHQRYLDFAGGFLLYVPRFPDLRAGAHQRGSQVMAGRQLWPWFQLCSPYFLLV
jgi:CRP/FNR family transcriptional regulator, cyclic AMP receptor protein